MRIITAVAVACLSAAPAFAVQSDTLLITYQGSASGRIMIRRPNPIDTNLLKPLSALGEREGPAAREGKDYLRTAQNGNNGQPGSTQSDSSSESAGANQNSTSNNKEDRSRNSRDKVELEEITVTAQRREENLRDVPIAISVLEGVDLDRSTARDSTDALSRIPGVSVYQNRTGASSEVTIRGAAGTIGTSTVGFYVDGIPFGFPRRIALPNTNIYDLDRIEVLRGPQGTLYGASSLNGVVRILTHDVDLEEIEGKFRLTGQQVEHGDSGYGLDGVVNFPIAPGRLGVRISGNYENVSGWIDRASAEDANSGEVRNLRVKLDAAPTDRLELGLGLWRSRTHFDQPSTSDDGFDSSASLDEPLTADFDAYNAVVSYEFDAFTFSANASYIDYYNDADADATPIGLPAVLVSQWPLEVTSTEFSLVSHDQTGWRWSLGAIYRDGESSVTQALPAFALTLIDFVDTSESYAVFGELTRIFADGKIELTGGLRYFEDDRKVSDRLSPYTAAGTFDEVSPRLVLTWKPADDLTMYASYSEGFRSGGPQGPAVAAAGFAPLESDILTNYEMGAKGLAYSRRLAYEASVYFMDWQDVQQSVGIPFAGTFTAADINTGTASGFGVDVGAVLDLTSSLSFGANASWNDLTFDEDILSSGVVLYAAGDRLTHSPEWTASAHATYRFDFSDRLKGEFDLSGTYRSSTSQRALQAGELLLAEGEDSVIARTSFSITTPDGWRGSVFIDNVTNEDAAVVVTPFGVPNWISHPTPRSFGFQLEKRF